MERMGTDYEVVSFFVKKRRIAIIFAYPPISFSRLSLKECGYKIHVETFGKKKRRKRNGEKKYVEAVHKRATP